MNPKLEALCDYILSGPGRRLTSRHLCWICFRSDFEAYLRLGHSITGTTWCKGYELAYPQGSDERWAARFIRSRQPWWAKLPGDLIAAGLFLRVAREAMAA